MLENANVKAEYQTIVQAPLPDVFGIYKAIIIANGLRLTTIQVDTIDNTRDYENNFGDNHFITVLLGVETLSQYVIPYKDNLKIELQRTSANVYGYPVSGISPTVRQYNAYPLDLPHPDFINQQRGRQVNTEHNELATQVPITFQLVDATLDQLRMTQHYGTRYDTGVMALLQCVYTSSIDSGASDALLKSSDYTGVRGVHMITPDNTTTYTQASPVILDLTPLPKVAQAVQDAVGVYSTGLGTYYQNGYWYIYPLYNHERFPNESKRLIIYNVPYDELVAPERSFKVRNGDVTIFATGDTKALDVTVRISAETGNAYSYTKAKDLFDGMTTRTDNKATPLTDQTNVSYGVLDNQNGLTNILYQKGQFTDNPYPGVSQIAQGKGVYISCLWENGLPDKYLYPGMPVKFFYEHLGQLMVVYGELLGARINRQGATRKHTDQMLITRTQLYLHLQASGMVTQDTVTNSAATSSTTATGSDVTTVASS